MAALLFVGFSSGLPILLVFKTLQSGMSDAGTDLTKIGWYGSPIGFPYAFKYLWSPLLDRQNWLHSIARSMTIVTVKHLFILEDYSYSKVP